MQKRTSRGRGIGGKWMSPIVTSSHPQCPHCGLTLDAKTWANCFGDACCAGCALNQMPRCHDTLMLKQLAQIGLVTAIHHGVRFFIAVTEHAANVAIEVLIPNSPSSIDEVTNARQRNSSTY